MPIATDFTRHDCKYGNRRITYATLQRTYRCRICSGRLGVKWAEKNDNYPDGWHVECLKCGSLDFIHELAQMKQATQEAEFIDGLPPALLEIAGLAKPKIVEDWVIFSLSPETIEI